MNQYEYEAFQKLAKLSQIDLKKALFFTLKDYYGKENLLYEDGYLVAKGDKIALISHLDTVHQCSPAEIYFDKDQGVIWSPQGIGGDDRCGVYAILQVVAAGYRPTIIFVEDEEIGGKGAYKLVSKYVRPMVELNCLIELDRMGDNDSVFYDCDNPEFEKYINNFGFETNFGTFSDISIIAPAWHTAAVNLSVGYAEEHTKQERIFVESLESTIEKLKLILQDGCPKQFNYVRSAIPSYVKYYQSLYNLAGVEQVCCYDCLEMFPPSKLIELKDEHGYTDYVCPDCYLKRLKARVPQEPDPPQTPQKKRKSKQKYNKSRTKGRYGEGFKF